MILTQPVTKKFLEDNRIRVETGDEGKNTEIFAQNGSYFDSSTSAMMRLL